MSYNFPNVMPPKFVTKSNWEDWVWQLKNSLKTHSDYQVWFSHFSHSKKAFEKTKSYFKSQTTPFYASLINYHNKQDPLLLMTVPDIDELNDSSLTIEDPLGEKSFQATDLIIHRYPDRVILLCTSVCATYCRYCFRKHFTAQKNSILYSESYKKSLAYIKENTQIKEVILSGGDPFSLSDEKLVKIIADIRSISHIDIIRIGTKFPVVNPYRVTKNLVKALQIYHPIYIMNHINHPQEISEQTAMALNRLANSGFPLMNQMVLLNGVNNHPALIAALNRRLLSLRVKPYYMFQCDPSKGSEKFITPLSDTLNIQKQLWGHLSGLAQSTISLDIPNGGGKISLQHQNSPRESAPGQVLLTGFDNIKGTYKYPQTHKTPYVEDLYAKEWANTVDRQR